MKITTELLNNMFSDIDQVKSVSVTYADGQTISGFYKRIVFDDITKPTVWICKHIAPRGEDPYHWLDYDKAVKIAIELKNGEIKEFS